ncbi:MAG: hypothetical protein WBA17_11140 [Saprospiraceae bacterium]
MNQLNYQVTIKEIETVDEVPEYWTNADYAALLEELSFPDADQLKPEEYREYLFMAIGDVEPAEAAKVLLTQQLSDDLNEHQIDQLAHDMLLDKIAEEYPDIALHARLFHVNQLLYKAYNGKFPNTKASIITCTVKPDKPADGPLTKAMLLKAFAPGLSSHCIIVRLFEDQLAGEAPFDSAENIIWELSSPAPDTYRIVTSDYWLNEEDFAEQEFAAVVTPFMEKEE